jgi:ubiquinone/menaquinone biosynthesis C-methylase UbiE
MSAVRTANAPPIVASDPQQLNRGWWESNPMTYDWEKTLQIESGTLQWYDEIDRRFLDSAYYAKGANGEPFGRFLNPDLVRGKQVLEIGCGMGTHAELLLRNGACLTAIDQTATAVDATRRRIQLKHLHAQVLQQDAEKLNLPDRAFDVVWTWGVIHHSSSTEQCVREIHRVLRPGGRLMMMVYYRPSLVFFVHCGLIRGIFMGQLFRQSIHEIYVNATDGYYARIFSKSDLRRLLARHFHSLRITVVGLKAELYPIPRNRLKIALERLTPDWFAKAILGKFGSMVVVEAIRS